MQVRDCRCSVSFGFDLIHLEYFSISDIVKVLWWVESRDVRGGAFSSGAGRGEDENPRGGAGRRWKSAGRGEKARKSTDLKIRQKCVNCYWRICITVWCFDQGKHYILWLLNGLSANQIITSCTKDQMNSFSFISFSSPFLAQMCGHNLCNLQSALPRCAPRFFSISAGRGGAGQGLLFAGRGGAGQPVFPWGGAGWGEHPWFKSCTYAFILVADKVTAIWNFVGTFLQWIAECKITSLKRQQRYNQRKDVYVALPKIKRLHICFETFNSVHEKEAECKKRKRCEEKGSPKLDRSGLERERNGRHSPSRFLSTPSTFLYFCANLPI